MKKFLSTLNPLSQCKEYHIPIWQCPQFLFLIMGLIIITAIISTYFIAALKTADPTLVVLFVFLVTLTLVIIDFIITRSFEKIAEASRMKTEFISIVSHQLRAPLTNLKYSLEVLISEKLEKSRKDKLEYFSILKENIDRMASLIDNLLIVSRMESEGLPLKKENISLNELIKKVILKFKPTADASNVKIILSVEKNIPEVTSDVVWLEQIVENLLDNSIRYIKNKGVVRIRIKQVGRKIYFEIEDNGVGIPKEEQKYIFEKFFRSKNVLKYQTQGSGLGLYIAKKVLESLNGNIWFESKEEKGSIFYVALPINKTDKKILK